MSRSHAAVAAALSSAVRQGEAIKVSHEAWYSAPGQDGVTHAAADASQRSYFGHTHEGLAAKTANPSSLR